MTLCKREHRSLNYAGMAEDPRTCRHRAGGKRSSNNGYRFVSSLKNIRHASWEKYLQDENHLDDGPYQEETYGRDSDDHTPHSGPVTPKGSSPRKRPRSSSSSSLLQCSKRMTRGRSRFSCSSSGAVPLSMEELQCIKKELKVIKNQIDELLNSLEHMDTHNRGASEGGLHLSPLCSSMSRVEDSSCSPLRSTRVFQERQSLEPRRTREEESQMKHHESDFYYI